jgi:hypothetical protein
VGRYDGLHLLSKATGTISQSRNEYRDAIALGLQFGKAKARRAMASIGFDIGMDMRNQEAWPDAAIGKVWFAAAAGDISTFSSLLESSVRALPFTGRVEEDRFDNIVRNVFQT